MRSKFFLLFAAATMLILAGCRQPELTTPPTAETSPLMTSTTTQKTTNSQLELPQAGDTIAVVETDLGTIKFRLFTKDIPELTKNFKSLASEGKYNNVPFHRVVKDFMIQTGDFTNKNGTGGYSYKGPGTNLPNEINPKYKHLYGTVSMAKTSAPVSIGSQFFIVTNKNGAAFLDGSYSPIGQVYEGMEVAEKIADIQVPGTEKPSKVVNMKKVTVTSYK